MDNNITECISGAFAESVFNRDDITIKNIALLGGKSRNNRIYTNECLQKSSVKYEGVKVYIDHPSSEEMKLGRRDVTRLAGKIVNARYAEGKVRGDFQGFGNNGRLLLEIAEKMPDVAGMSHNATAFYKRSGNQEVIEEINNVISVDLVSDPATNNGMFESEQRKEKTMEYTDITLESLKVNRPDLYRAIEESGVEQGKESLKEKIQTMESKLDEYQTKETLAKKRESIEKQLKESKIPEQLVTDVFRNTLMNAEESEVNKLIEDRKLLIQESTGGVKNYGESKDKVSDTDTKVLDDDKAFANFVS